ncbi:uncharacterized protein LOC125859062 [Solanum stenotomum]|uniref:uncharacterized protein LOC125859062 n=1 Tax=Solanum stenotomum TaxID=172797 RepID=UPI0020D0A2D7|nr:uncharacterized protein LOC125859062 [Solanum stenotomum]
MASTYEQSIGRQQITKDLRQLASLGVRLLESPDEGVIVQNAAESSFVAEVKEKQYTDPILLQLKENVQQVKVEHQKPGGYMQRIELPIWKWDMINMDFVTDLPCSFRKFDSIWVIVDRLTKAAYFLPVKTTYTVEEYAKLYIKEFGNASEFKHSLSPSNECYHSSIRMVPYEALYGRKCRSPIGWFEVGETVLFGLDLVHQAMEKVKVIQQGLATTQSRHKSYADNRRRGLEFFIGDWVFLKELELSKELSTVHPVFHVSMLRKCIGDPSRITPTKDVHVTEDLTYEDVPMAILDRQVKKLRNKEVAYVKVLWRNQQVEDVTWEAEEAMKSKYPHLFQFEEKGQSAELRQ